MSNRVSLSPSPTNNRRTTPFTPPKSPHRSRHSCVCNWGHTCADYRSFFNGYSDHPFAGEAIKLEYSNSCHFQNLWHRLPNFIKMSSQKKQEIEDQYKKFVRTDGKSTRNSKSDKPTVKIARHHWPLQFFSTTGWLQPMTASTMNELGCYANRNPPPYQDKLLHYDTSLGEGLSARWISTNNKNNERMYIKVPCFSVKQVEQTAIALISPSAPTISIVRETSRTPKEWNNMLEEKETKIVERDKSISTLKRRVEELEGQLGIQADRHKKRAMRATSSLDDEQKKAYVEHGKSVMIDDIMKLVASSGGLSRLTICNDAWHKVNGDAAKLLFGYRNWDETKIYVTEAFFPGEVEGGDPSLSITWNTGEPKLPDLNSFEKCLLVKMFLHVFPNQQVIGLIMGRHRTRIGQILKEWAPRWGNVGMDLSCLDITRDYLLKEKPQLHINAGGNDLVYVDGKDWYLSAKQNDNTIVKATFSSKNETDSARGLTYSTAAGLTFESTPMMAARIGEKQLQRYWGSLGPVSAPVKEWEDVKTKDPLTTADKNTFWTANDLFMTGKEYDRLVEKFENDSAMMELGAVDDGILLTAQPTGLAQLGLEADAGDSDDDDDDEKVDRKGFNYGTSKSCEWYEELMKQRLVEESLKESVNSSDDKEVPVLSPEVLDKINEKYLSNDPNMSGKRKLMQYERHERLHRLYEDGRLHKCLMSYFLLCTADNRMKLLSWMGSDMAKDIEKPSVDDLPELPLRLAKIPEDVGVGGDKGFDDISADLPNVNDCETPVKVKNSKTHRLSTAQILSEVPITTKRAGCETVFKRVQGEAVLHEKIPYWLIPYLPHAHAVAHGHANLYKPLRTIGSYSIVGSDYWRNVKQYTRREQSSISARSVQSSSRRRCMKCKQEGGELTLCTACNKWYHNECLDSHICNKNNPYN